MTEDEWPAYLPPWLATLHCRSGQQDIRSKTQLSSNSLLDKAPDLGSGWGQGLKGTGHSFIPEWLTQLQLKMVVRGYEGFK